MCDQGKVAIDTDEDGVLDECLEDFTFIAKPTPEPVEAPTAVATPAATPVAVVCEPATTHGEQHEMVPTDTDGDGIADECRLPHEHPHEVIEVPEPTVEAAWLPDPSCRNEHRWWDGYMWTRNVGNGGVQTEDRFVGDEDYPPPVAGVPPNCDGGVSDIFFSGDISGPEDCPNTPSGVVTAPFDSDQDGVADVCAVLGSDAVLRPMGAAELGCNAVSPAACTTGSDGWPVATRLMTHDEIAATGTYRDGQLSVVAPVSVPESAALGYITECLQGWSTYSLARYDPIVFHASPVSACNALWRLPVNAIDHLGADPRCVWDAFVDLYLEGGPIVAPNIQTGWAERCASWLDPNPGLQFIDKCLALFERVSSSQYNSLQLGQRVSICTFDEQTYTAHELGGRCSQLVTLNTMTRRIAAIAKRNGHEYDESLSLPPLIGEAIWVC